MSKELQPCCLKALRRMARGQALSADSWFGCCEVMEEQGLCEWTVDDKWRERGWTITDKGRASLSRPTIDSSS